MILEHAGLAPGLPSKFPRNRKVMGRTVTFLPGTPPSYQGFIGQTVSRI
jgi:hypothetical protein